MIDTEKGKRITFYVNTDEELRLKQFLVGTEKLSLFAHRAMIEKLNRLESRDAESVAKTLFSRKEILRETVRDILEEIK